MDEKMSLYIFPFTIGIVTFILIYGYIYYVFTKDRREYLNREHLREMGNVHDD